MEGTIGKRMERKRWEITFQVAEDGHILHTQLMEGAQDAPAAGKVAQVAIDDARQDVLHAHASFRRFS
jgi:hypothetical protein